MPMFKKQMLVVLVIALVAVGASFYDAFSSDEVVRLDAGINRDVGSVDATDKTDAEKIFVYVTGAVNNPGMIELNGADLRIADAVNGAGGLLPTADVDNFNMAAHIDDGQHIRVPEKISARTITTDDPNDSASGSNDGLVNINTASAEELQTLKGIGPATAQSIIDYRQIHGEFRSIDEIQEVRGIGPKKFENIKDRIKI